MGDITISLAFFVILFLSMLLFVYLGNKIYLYQVKKYPERRLAKNKIIEGAIFALMGLLIAFTLAGARERFDIRRNLVIEEANAIKTAYLRFDLLPSHVKEDLQKAVKEYLQLRINIYKKMPHTKKAASEIKQSEQLQLKIWQTSVKFCQQQNTSAACIVLLPAVNQMIDISNSRFETTRIHPPVVVFFTLIILALLSAILSGYSISTRSSWPMFHILLYASIISFTIFIILNLEYPHLGFITIDYFNEVLIHIDKNL